MIKNFGNIKLIDVCNLLVGMVDAKRDDDKITIYYKDKRDAVDAVREMNGYEIPHQLITLDVSLKD